MYTCAFRKLHRVKVEQFLDGLNAEIDQAAEIDSAYFWKLVNQRKRSSNSSPGCEIKFNGVTYRDSKAKAEQWGSYFKEIYTPSISSSDNNSEYKIREYENNKSSLINISYNDIPDVSTDEIIFACKRAKRNKACGYDNIYYENIIYGGDILYALIAKLFSYMDKYGYTPNTMKKGIIITFV